MLYPVVWICAVCFDLLVKRKENSPTRSSLIEEDMNQSIHIHSYFLYGAAACYKLGPR